MAFISTDPGFYGLVATHRELGFSLSFELIFKLPKHVCMLLCILDRTLELEVLQVWSRTAQDLLNECVRSTEGRIGKAVVDSYQAQET